MRNICIFIYLVGGDEVIDVGRDVDDIVISVVDDVLLLEEFVVLDWESVDGVGECEL